jgi:hypothetical protein
VLGHHPYTNVEGVDPDIETTEHDIRRIKTSQVYQIMIVSLSLSVCVLTDTIRNQPWYRHYLAQHVYTPLVYCFLAWKTRYQVSDIQYSLLLLLPVVLLLVD